MTVLKERGKVHNGSIVFAQPLALPDGSEVMVQIELPASDLLSTASTSGDSADFAQLPCFGMWKDREDMAGRDSKST